MAEFSMKELYSVVLKTTYPIEIEGQEIEAGEVVAAFDKIQISNWKEISNYVTAHGGYQDAPRVWWENTKDVKINFSQGIFSELQFALMSNSRLVNEITSNEKLMISKREEVETSENGEFEIEKEPQGRIFVYEKKTKQKIGSIESSGRYYKTDMPFTDLIIDYNYEYTSKYRKMIVGQRLIEGFLTLEGKTRVKDDITGRVRTGIIYIPKLKLTSDLSMNLGENATPVLGYMSAIACPTGSRGNPKVIEIAFLDDDIDSDIQ